MHILRLNSSGKRIAKFRKQKLIHDTSCVRAPLVTQLLRLRLRVFQLIPPQSAGWEVHEQPEAGHFYISRVRLVDRTFSCCSDELFVIRA